MNNKILGYFILDRIKNGDEWVSNMMRTKESAIKRADEEWSHLSQHDKDRRESFDVMMGFQDEESNICLSDGYETIKSYK